MVSPSLVFLLAAAFVNGKPEPVHDKAAIAIMDRLDRISAEVVQVRQLAKKDAGLKSTCTLETARRRTDWARLSASDRRSYTSAVLCLMTQPSRYNSTAYPGARSRFDDFVAQHIDITPIHHGSFSFLAFHRYFIWAYETELRECGYQGAQPYWDWFSYVNDLTQSPVFDGSDTSMSGDGSFVAHNGSFGGLAGPMAIFMPSGGGGGCVTSGPFVNSTVSLGPVSPGMDGQAASAASGYNPRCVVRDLTSYATASWMSAANVANLTYGAAAADIGTWQDELQGRGFGGGFLGMHAAGHYAMGGNAADLWSSNNDPAFWLHHAMVDRLWAGWQYLYSAERKGGWEGKGNAAGDGRGDKVAGTMTISNMPPSRDGTLDDTVDLLGLGDRWDKVKVRDLMDPMGGVTCYLYV